MERVALYLQDSHDLRDGLDYARYAEAKGFEAVWQAESRLVRDAIVPILTDSAGNVTEGPGFNIFSICDGVLATPDRGGQCTSRG